MDTAVEFKDDKGYAESYKAADSHRVDIDDRADWSVTLG